MSSWTNLQTALALTFIPLYALADSQATDNLNFNWGGVISQGWTHTTDNNFNGESSKSFGSLEYREIALYGSYELSPEIRLSGQLLSREAGETQDSGINVDHLIFDWSFLQKTEFQAGVRVGRIKNHFGFYNDTRDIAFTRPSILLPQSLYQDRIRDISLSSDGVGFYSRTNIDYGYLSFDLQYGEPKEEKNAELALLGSDLPGQFVDSDVLLFRTLYESPANQLRLAFTRIDSRLPFSEEVFVDSKLEFQVTGVSAQWNLESWSITTEYMHETLNRKGFLGLPGDSTTKSKVYYIQLDRRFNSQFTGFLRYDAFILDRSDPDGVGYAMMTGMPAHQRFAKDWTVGVGYQPSKDWLFRAEWHHIDGTAWLSVLDNPEVSDTERNWNMMLLQASYRF